MPLSSMFRQNPNSMPLDVGGILCSGDDDDGIDGIFGKLILHFPIS